MPDSPTDTNELLRRAQQGDQVSVEKLFHRHRHKLRQMIALRLDARLRQRCDPSDVIQETLAAAVRKLPDYLQTRPLPFYPWLRQIAWERLVDIHRHHFAGKRTVAQENLWEPSEESVTSLADRLIGNRGEPGDEVIRQELLARVRTALQRVSEDDRDLLLMRYAEQLRVPEIASLLEIGEAAVKSRVRRALERLHGHLRNDFEDSS